MQDPARGHRLRRCLLWRPHDAEAAQQALQGPEVRRLRLRQRGPVLLREAAGLPGQARQFLGLARLHLREGRREQGAAGGGDGPEEQQARAPQQVRRAAQGRRGILGQFRRRLPRRKEALGGVPRGGLRVSLRVRERDQQGGGAAAGEQGAEAGE